MRVLETTVTCGVLTKVIPREYIGKMGVGKMGVGKMGVGKMGAGEMGLTPHNNNGN